MREGPLCQNPPGTLNHPFSASALWNQIRISGVNSRPLWPRSLELPRSIGGVIRLPLADISKKTYGAVLLARTEGKDDLLNIKAN